MPKTILVVTHKAREVCNLLRKQGYLVDEAKGGQEPLRAILNEKYALIVSDLSSDGLQTLETAKAFCPAVPVVLTSDEHLLTKSEAMQLGAHDLIENSELASEQIKKIQSALDRPYGVTSGLPLSNTIRKVA